jgi:hypothetical protein
VESKRRFLKKARKNFFMLVRGGWTGGGKEGRGYPASPGMTRL